jgi:hypothetical protein
LIYVAIKGLEKINQKIAEKATFTGDGESPFLTLKDGEKYTVRFIQELDSDVESYDERRGLIQVVEEHTSPKNYKLRAVCTFEEEGRCWACEQTTLPEIGKKWKPRMRFYANVLVRGDTPKVKILAQGFGDKNIGKLLVDMAEMYEGLGATDFVLSRSGSGMNDTSYRLLPLPKSKALSKEEQTLEVKDLTKFIKHVPYDAQSAFYLGTEGDGGSDDWVE